MDAITSIVENINLIFEKHLECFDTFYKFHYEWLQTIRFQLNVFSDESEISEYPLTFQNSCDEKSCVGNDRSSICETSNSQNDNCITTPRKEEQTDETNQNILSPGIKFVDDESLILDNESSGCNDSEKEIDTENNENVSYEYLVTHCFKDLSQSASSFRQQWSQMVNYKKSEDVDSPLLPFKFGFVEEEDKEDVYMMSDDDSVYQYGDDEIFERNPIEIHGKMVPRWARGEYLLKILRFQAKIDPDTIFCGLTTSLSLSEIFGTTKSNWENRSDSGWWDPDRVTEEENHRFKVAIGLIRDEQSDKDRNSNDISLDESYHSTDTKNLSLLNNKNNVKKRISVFENSGKAFLTPSRGISKPKKSFLIDKKPISKQDLMYQIHRLKLTEGFRVAMALGLNPPSLDKVKFFVSRISATDISMLEKVQLTLSSVVKPSSTSEQFYAVRSSLKFPVSDVRYQIDPTYKQLFTQPFKVGGALFSESFKVPTIPKTHRLILQSFIAGVEPPTVKWPNTLIINANGIHLTPKNLSSLPLVDLSMVKPDTTISLSVGHEEKTQFFLMIRIVRYNSVSELITQIKNKKLKQGYKEVFNEVEASLISPITNDPICYPGKGINCTHTQCFDLKEYLKLAFSTNLWQCPICKLPVVFDDLVYSQNTRELIEKLVYK